MSGTASIDLRIMVMGRGSLVCLYVVGKVTSTWHMG